jgi:hypothetical protein
LEKAVSLPGEHGPLRCDCNTIFPLWGCECYSAKLCLKTSFIIHRLQTEIIFDNLCRKQAAFWLLASRLKGGNTCSLSAQESTDNLLTPFPRESTQMFPWNKTTTLSSASFCFNTPFFSLKVRHLNNNPQHLHFYFGY